MDCLNNNKIRVKKWAKDLKIYRWQKKKSHNGSQSLVISVCVCAQLLCWVWLFAIPGTVAHQASLSMRFPRQEYWSGLPFPSPRNLSYLGIKSLSPALQADCLPPSNLGRPSAGHLSSVLVLHSLKWEIKEVYKLKKEKTRQISVFMASPLTLFLKRTDSSGKDSIRASGFTYWTVLLSFHNIAVGSSSK